MTDLQKMLIYFLLCYVIAKYCIQSFLLTHFFYLGQFCIYFFGTDSVRWAYAPWKKKKKKKERESQVRFEAT